MTMQESKRPKSSANSNSLDSLFKNILKFFNSQAISSSNKETLSSLPWYLILGQPETGKTTLIKNSQQRFIFSKKIKDKTTTKNKQCNWWVTNEAVFLDIPGYYLLPRDRQRINPLWVKFTKLIHKYKLDTKIKGILVLLDAHDLLTRSDTSNQFRLSQLAQGLMHFDKQCKCHVPIHLLLNKCDLIPGFVTFFADQGKEYREQPWGFELVSQSEEDAPPRNEQLKEQFNQLIKQLNDQLLWQLHHEVNDNKRLLIKSFPLQIEQLKIKTLTALHAFMSQLENTELHLNGVYITSGTQYEVIDASIASQMPMQIDLSEQTATDSKRPFFVTELFDRFIKFGRLLPEKKRKWRHRSSLISVIGICALLVVLFIAMLAKDFAKHVNSLSKASGALNHYQTLMHNNDNPNIATAIQVLNDISTADQYIGDNNSAINRVIFSTGHNLKGTLQNARQYALYHIFIPAIEKYLKQYLSTHDNDPGRLYVALKIYLMLGNKIPLDQAYIATHLSQLFSNQNDDTYLSSDAAKLVIVALNENYQPIAINKDLVQQTRDQLGSLQATELAYIMLYAQSLDASNITLDQAIETKALRFNTKYKEIPNIYTAAAYKKIYPTLLQKVAHDVIHGNAVLGKSNHHHNLNEARLVSQLKALYLKEYANTWEDALTHIDINSITSFAELAEVSDKLSSVDSPILQLLQLVHENADFPEILSQSPQLQQFITLLNELSDPDKSQIYQVFSALRELSKSSKELASTQNKGEIALSTASKLLSEDSRTADHMLTTLQSLTKSTPDPINTWVQQMTANYWKLLLQNSGEYINQQWATQILAPFKRDFTGKYPFSKKASEDAKLADFNNFFKKGGLLDAFEEKYIFPFMQYQNKTWQVKPEVASVMTIPKVVLTQLKRLAHIQAAYFSEKGNAPFAQFSLQPTSADQTVRSFDLVYAQDHVLFDPSMPNAPVNISWPNDGDSNDITLVLKDNNGKTQKKVFTGPWSWMKLVGEFSAFPVQITDKKYPLDFNINGNKATYVLANTDAINPFAAAYLQKTWMPHWVFQISKN